MDYFMEEELLMLIPGLLSSIPTGIFSIATYVLTSLALYAIASRRGLRKPWLAWIPVVNCWLLGSISDQYQYVVKGETKSKRKWLLVLGLVNALLTFLVVSLALVAVSGLIFSGPGYGMGRAVATQILGILGLALPLAAVAVAYLVIRYMVLYDVYRSVDPNNSVLYLVLSILFNPTEPFFLFFNREKDLGMPPRKQRTVDAEYVEAEIV